MSIDKKYKVNPEYEKPKSRKRSVQLVYVALVIIIASLLVSAPVLYSWITSEQDTSHNIVFVLESEDPSWHTGEISLWFDGGFLEIQPPHYPTPMYDEENAQIGWKSTIAVNRNFTEPETCRFEYLCSELNMTIGPFPFISNQPQILYQDSSGRIIELWVGH
ncbi:MAG: hypothetical protein ACW96M_02005 [Candidatus Thorarchaeota archaeon]